MGVNPELPGVNLYITTCLHGVDMRFTPRCYLCKPWPEDSPVFTINPSGGHRHEGEWCAKCVEHGEAEARAPLEAEIARLRAIESAARRLPAPDLDAKRRRYTIASDEPDFHALRAALEEPTP